jgi:hypothetical protein
VAAAAVEDPVLRKAVAVAHIREPSGLNMVEIPLKHFSSFNVFNTVHTLK